MLMYLGKLKIPPIPLKYLSVSGYFEKNTPSFKKNNDSLITLQRGKSTPYNIRQA
jgi:hypothetical protein